MQNYSPYIQGILEHLKNDEFFQADLKSPLVLEAINHWLGIKRLTSEVAEEKFGEDYRVLQTFGKFKNLQEACAKEGVRFPLEIILNKESKQEETTTTTTTTKSVLRRAKSDQKLQSKESSSAAVVSFAEPPHKEVLFSSDDNNAQNYYKSSSYISLEPFNIARFWSLQILFISIYCAYK